MEGLRHCVGQQYQSQRKSRFRSESNDPRDRNSCSQIRATSKFWRLSSFVIFRARWTFERIFFVQYSRFDCGTGLLHLRHPCQKQPSIKTARFLSRKTKSGDPIKDESCKVHPLIRLRIRAERNLHSVERLPFERTFRIRSLRSSFVSVSINSFRAQDNLSGKEDMQHA
jgi:hypothetical protein